MVSKLVCTLKSPGKLQIHLYPASRYCDLIGLQCGLGVGIFKSSLDDSDMQVDLGAVTSASHLAGVPVMLTE